MAESKGQILPVLFSNSFNMADATNPLADLQLLALPEPKQDRHPCSLALSKLKEPSLQMSQLCPSTLALHWHFPVVK